MSQAGPYGRYSPIGAGTCYLAMGPPAIGWACAALVGHGGAPALVGHAPTSWLPIAMGPWSVWSMRQRWNEIPQLAYIEYYCLSYQVTRHFYTSDLPLFTPSTVTSNLASLAAEVRPELSIPATGDTSYNPAVGLPSHLVLRILNCEFIETDMLLDSWLQEINQPVVTLDGQVLTSRQQLRRAPVQDLSLWIKCYLHMAVMLVSWFPDKGPEQPRIPLAKEFKTVPK